MKEPYSNPSIISICTGLPDQFKYSPCFCKPIADTTIPLSGYRKKDYICAEGKTGHIHKPKQTVWHHVWPEKHKEPRIQLVEWSDHCSTIPHAGGCKAYTMETGNRYRYASCTDCICYRKYVYQNVSFTDEYGNTQCRNSRWKYTDIVIDFVLDATDELFVLFSAILDKYASKKVQAMELTPFAGDPYGNMIFADKNDRLFFLNVETFTLNKINISKSDVIAHYKID